jgi:hypothetical protein
MVIFLGVFSSKLSVSKKHPDRENFITDNILGCLFLLNTVTRIVLKNMSDEVAISRIVKAMKKNPKLVAV